MICHLKVTPPPVLPAKFCIIQLCPNLESVEISQVSS